MDNLYKNKKYYKIDAKNREFHHLKNVLRIKKGEVITGFNGKGLCAEFKIKEVKRDYLILETEKMEFFEKRKSRINLGIAVVKPKNFNFILKTIVQIGVNNVFPFICEYSYLKNISKDKIEKWNSVIIESAKQSGNNHLTFIKKIYNFNEIIELPYKNKFLFDLEGEPFRVFENCIKNNLDEILLIIGPEGGFSEKEKEVFTNLNLKKIKLDFHIMRAEVAAISILTLAKYICGEI